jgi:thermitase
MRKALPSILFIIFCITLLIPINPMDTRNNEMDHKQSILQKDLDQTSGLCRTQCSIDFMQVLKTHDLEMDINSSLQALQKEHPHMVQLSWIDSSQGLEEGIKVGSVPKELDQLSLASKKDALHFLKRQQREKIYQSPPLYLNNEEYFVMGAASKDHGPYLIGLIHQNLLKQIAVEQRKNLRIVPYPSDKRYNIKSADSETLDKVHVQNAEDNEGVSHYHNKQVVVKFKKEPTKKQLNQIQKEIQISKTKKLGYTYVFQSKKLNAEQLVGYFQKWDIQYVEPHFLYLTNDQTTASEEFIPNDSLYQQYQWNLPIIETVKGWDLSKGSEDIIVAVIDTGVDLDHSDLSNRLVEGINIIDEQSPPYDDVGHGTHVAGVISATVNNIEGVAGMSWYNKVMPIKALDHTGAGSTYSVAQGIIWAVDHGAKVINMSLGNYANAEFLHDAVKYAFDRDVILIAATGNDNTEEPGYPAAYPEVLAVSATNSYQDRASFSNYGNYVDVVAPGENIASTYPDDQYAGLSGTSMASPHVAALAAMIRTANPLLKNTEVMDILRYTSLDLGQKGRDKYYGFGQIDVVKALHHTTQTNMSLALWSNLLERKLQQIDLKYEAGR